MKFLILTSLLFLTLFPLLTSSKFLQLFDTLESENSNPNGYHMGEPEPPSNSPPSLIDYMKNATESYSFKQIPDDVPALSVKIPQNDDYLKDSFSETSLSHDDLSSLETQAAELINEDKPTDKADIEMGKALQKTRDFIQKAINTDINVGVSKDDLMNLLKFSDQILDKCNGDYLNCKVQKKESTQPSVTNEDNTDVNEEKPTKKIHHGKKNTHKHKK